MKVLFFNAFLFLHFFSANAQELTEVKYKDSKESTIETYSVLKNNTSIKQGPYKKTYKKKFTMLCGNYLNNLKDSIWIEYNYDGKHIRSKGEYKNDQEISIWEYYNHSGGLIMIYDYSKRELIKYNIGNDPEADRMRSATINEYDGPREVLLDRPPIYIGGWSKLNRDINKNMRFPSEALEKNKGCEIYINFIVHKNGDVFIGPLKYEIGYGFDEEVKRISEILKKGWLPALYNNQPIDMIVPVPLKYSIVKSL